MKGLHGFVMLHRKILDWEWYADTSVRSVFIHLLLLASFKKTSWQGQALLPGQVITSYGHISTSLGLSIQQVRTALNKLQSTGEIRIRATNKYTLVSIEKWALYQCDTEQATNEQQPKQQTNNKQITNHQQHRNTVNNDNNVYKVNAPARTAAPVKSSYAKPEVFSRGDYDYDLLRKKARERIKKLVGTYEESA